MKETSSGGIVFRRQGEKVFFLLLHYKYKSDYWSFTRGNMKESEDVVDTAKREIFEESDLTKLNFIDGFKEKTKFIYTKDGRKVYKNITIFLVETNQKDVTVSHEHVGFDWLEFDAALERLKFKNDKEVLTKANQFLIASSS